MKYKNVTLGQIEAMINKLGGESGMQDFLSGKLEVIKKKISAFGKDVLNGKGSFMAHDSCEYTGDFAVLVRFDNRHLPVLYNVKNTTKASLSQENALISNQEYKIKVFPLNSNPEKDEVISFMESNQVIWFDFEKLPSSLLNQSLKKNVDVKLIQDREKIPSKRVNKRLVNIDEFNLVYAIFSDFTPCEEGYNVCICICKQKE